MSGDPTVNEWALVREQFDALVRDRSDNIEDIFDAQFRKRFSQLIPERPSASTELSATWNQFDLQIAAARAILHDLHRDVGAHWTFKGALVVIGVIRLNTGEPHLRLAERAKRTPDNSLLGKYLIFSHATPFGWLASHTHELKVPIKRVGQWTSST
jgi:hypothetical protein